MILKDIYTVLLFPSSYSWCCPLNYCHQAISRDAKIFTPPTFPKVPSSWIFPLDHSEPTSIWFLWYRSNKRFCHILNQNQLVAAVPWDN